MKKFIVYARVSTDKQEHGKEAQISSAKNYAKSVGGNVIEVFSENASGKNDQREGLKHAIAACKDKGATLLIAKLDRLSRNAAFLFALKSDLDKANVEVIAADMPEVLSNTLMLSVMAGMAQHEREIISQRTKAGLEVARKKGKKIGRPKGYKMNEASKQKISEGNKKKRKDVEPMVINIISQKRKEGKTFDAIAHDLNELGATTPNGNKFYGNQVRRIYEQNN